MGLLQPFHLIVILLIVVLIFGPGKLPDVGSSLGKSIKEFRQAMKDVNEPTDAPTTSAAGKQTAEPHEEKSA